MAEVNKLKVQKDESGALIRSLAGFAENLSIINVPASKMLLTQAGYRSPTAFTSYLAAHIVTPLIVGLLAGYLLLTVFGLYQSEFEIAAATNIAAFVFGFFLPRFMVNNQAGKRKMEIRLVFPDALDLMLICVESGMTIEQALRKVAEEFVSISTIFSGEITTTLAELSYLGDRRVAYNNLAYRTGVPSIKNACLSLTQAERFGTSIGATLRIIAEEVREDRMNAAEKKAASLPPLLTLPMMVFFMPVLLIIIMAPAGISLIGSF